MTTPAPKLPPVVVTLIALNVAVFVATVALAGKVDAVLSPPERLMLAFGANYARATFYELRVETLLTSCFLHFGVIHLAFNMAALKQLGAAIERTVGSGRFASLYVMTGIAGSMTSAAWGLGMTRAALTQMQDPELVSAWVGSAERVSAGASGAICGVLGAFLVIGLRIGGFRDPIARSMTRGLGMVLLFGFIFRFDNAAHVGGAVTGALLATTWERRVETPRERVTRLVVAGVLVAAAFARVGFLDARDPYALLRAPQRAAVARDRATAGRCAEARGARDRAARLAPEAKEEIDALLGTCR